MIDVLDGSGTGPLIPVSRRLAQDYTASVYGYAFQLRAHNYAVFEFYLQPIIVETRLFTTDDFAACCVGAICYTCWHNFSGMIEDFTWTFLRKTICTAI